MEATLCASTYGPFCKTISKAATPKLIFNYDSSRGRLAGRLFDVHFACSLAVCVRSRAFLSCDSSSLRPGWKDQALAAERIELSDQSIIVGSLMEILHARQNGAAM